MTALLPRSSQRSPDEPAGDTSDRAFWLAKLDAGIPRAQIVPDFKRSTATAHTYRSIAFTVDPEVTRELRRLASTQDKVSEVTLCAGLLTVLFAKYHRHDEMVIGFHTRTADSADARVVPLHLIGPREATLSSVLATTAAEVGAVLARVPCTAATMAQLLGVQIGEGQCPFFDVGLSVGEGDGVFDLSAYPVDVAFVFDVTHAGLRGSAHFAADLFETSSIERLISHLHEAAGHMARRPAATLAEIDVRTPQEREQLRAFCGRSVTFGLDRPIHELFEEQVRRRPDNIAAIYRDVRLTYAQLNARANRLAHTLLSRGLEKGAFVGILLNRGCDFLTAMLGVFKAGGAYVPLDPTYPRDRIRYMLDDSQAAVVVSNAPLLTAFGDVIADLKRLEVVVSVEGTPERAPVTVVSPATIQAAFAHDPALSLTGRDRAYMIYTSGSTGRPKGAICRHDGALNHLYGELEGVGIDREFSFLQTAASSSDISVWQFVAPLLFGGATVIVDYDVVVDPARLWTAIRDHRITVAEVVPVVLRALIDHIADLPSSERTLPDLRVMMSTGEALAAELVDRWLSYFPGIPMANTYGPTETSDDVTLLVVREPLARRHAVVPIGRPLPNVFVFVLDRDLEPVPVGVPGEICIAGIGVGEGYWQQPEKTAAAFVPCPIREIDGGPMYRTGDLGRWLSDGSIEFLGRIDQQVKVRGFRVEPGEIEAVLTQHPAVQDAAVVAVDSGTGTNRLVGYFVTHREHSVDPADLRQFLKSAVADHMIPAALIPLRALPLTPLGKVDRKALSSMEPRQEVDGEAYVPPRDDLERVLAESWSRVLGQRVGVHDNYFEIGGDSILVIHAVAQLKKLGLSVAPKHFFLHPTVSELAGYLRSTKPAPESAGGHGSAPVRAESRGDAEALRQALGRTYPDLEDVYPLAPTQRGMYLQLLLASRSAGGYIEQISFDLTGDLDESAFAAAWQQTVDTTDVLRSAVIRRGVPEPMQLVRRSIPLALDIGDWRHRADVHREAPLAALAVEERKKGFDLGAAPLMRVTLVRLADTRWHCLWTYHHIILDGWSEPLVLDSVFRAYEARVAKRPTPPVRSTRYRDFAAWLESRDQSAAETFWRRQLAGFVCPASITDASAAIEPLGKAELSHDSHDIVLTDSDTRRLNDVARRHKLTFSTIVHGAWGMLLHHRAASPDVVFGSVASGRQCDYPGIEAVPGVVVVTQPVRTRLAVEATLAGWLQQLQRQMAEIREFEHTPLGLVEQWCDVPAEKRPLFDTIVVMANYAGSDLTTCSPAEVGLSNVRYMTQPLYALTLFVVPSAGSTVLRLVYDKRRYAPATVAELLEDYRRLLTRIADNAEQSLGSALI